MRVRRPPGAAVVSTLLLTASLAVPGRALAASSPSQGPIRVLVAEGRPLIRASGPAGLRVAAAGEGAILSQGRANEPISLLPVSRGVALRGGPAAPAVVLSAPDGGPVSVEGRPYRGRVEVHHVDGGLAAVNVLRLEEYLQGVLSAEVPPHWPLEAMKAQAVAARTYALYQMGQNPGALFHVRATTASQVYAGLNGEDPRASLAIQETRGLILALQGQPIAALYHADSGGQTEDGSDVFGQEYGYLVGVEDGFDLASPYYLWQASLSREAIQQALREAGVRVGRILGVEALGRSRTGRVLRVRVRHAWGSTELEGKVFRQLMGNDLIRSTKFVVREEGGTLIFVGNGWGHGVGLSQWGAKGMAELAYSFLDILQYYYPTAQVIRLGAAP